MYSLFKKSEAAQLFPTLILIKKCF